MKLSNIAYASLFLSFCALTCPAAFAGNEGPQAAPPAPAKLVAEISVGLPLVPPTMPYSIKYQILSDGRMQIVSTSRQASQTHLVATLASDVVAALKADAESAVAGKLVDPKPESPGCFDAPFVSYKAYKEDGTAIELSRQAQCKGFEKDNLSDKERQVKSALDTLRNLEAIK